MLTCCSEIDLVISDKSPVLSSASTWIAARNRELSRGAQCTVTVRSGSDSIRCSTLMQSVRCTDTPLPLVTKPMILSPGTGVQHFDNRAHTSAAPSTATPESPVTGRGLVGLVSTVASARSSCAPASPPADLTNFATTDCALTWPSPIAAYRPARSG